VNYYSYTNRPIACDAHKDFITGEVKKVIVSHGMVSTDRGLICPMCYAHVRYATEEEIKSFDEAKFVMREEKS
jgi:hypothetical protein